MRKITFLKTEAGYKPVNKKAQMLAKGKVLQKAAVKKLAAKNLSVYVWTNAGLRKVA